MQYRICIKQLCFTVECPAIPTTSERGACQTVVMNILQEGVYLSLSVENSEQYKSQ